MIRNERGIALMVVLLVSLAVAAIALGASLMSTSTQAVNLYSDRLGTLEAVADGGIEWARARVNANRANYPDSGYKTLESGVAVKDASGATIPGVQRWTYVGPTGISSGQYGVFGSAVVVVKDAFGNVIVRRGEVYQESFAKFAYFTDNEGGNIVFGSGDQIWGPVHTNDQIQINNANPKPQVWFHNTVETASTITNKTYGAFDQGYIEHGANIPMPSTADLNKLKTQAQAGNTAITGNTGGNYGQATTRIEFVAVDLNNDLLVNGPNEGFFRVYQVGSSTNAYWVVGDLPSGKTYVVDSPNCADSTGHGALFRTATSHGSSPHTAATGMQQPSRRCFLGGSEFLDDTDNLFDSTDTKGRWLRWPGPAVDSVVRNRRPRDWAFLWPITRAYNPSFKGVIHVEGNVAVSGTLRGQVTLAATGNVVIADDIRYATDPGAGLCVDMLGLFAGSDVIIADNTLNSPQRAGSSGSASTYRTYDDTKDEFIQGVVLALNIFTAENYDGGPSDAEDCEAKNDGRGCIYLTGGIIQDTRGAVGLTDGTGYIKRYAYDQCVLNSPPPYFPTTGHFARGRFFEVDPLGFDVTAFYHSLGPK
jgi:hypothetical protein